ncbi:rhodanese-related sulfurtransferase [Streptomyces sp. SAI-117]|uniref:rhodanese-like domain-containing protein n=1 Tax=unclassified Streptomyces TaxID=2593676 RepID=UPI002473E58E|nr:MULTISPECIES: rhodanese-like domain-containing protein [unclassified Streptomyces]MDH6572972.1 rhodanese-related sulfurtransferase [Streptomyces sp. SAI-117]MDH6582066.1 rhodanese-related sulfurtransferase [Streptomyces sp. SAI-133]
MSIFRRARGGPGRVSVQEAALRTGHDRGEGGGEAVLLDVREPYEWQAGHAPGAVHLPLSALAAGAGLPAHAQARPLLVICRSGNRSRQAAELLVARGAQAVDVVGGMRDWARAGLPVVDARGQDGTIA